MDTVSFEVDPGLATQFRNRSEIISKQRGSLLFRQGDVVTGLYLLNKGKARLQLQATNGQVIFERIVGKHCLIGLPATMIGKPYSVTAELIEDSELYFISGEAFVELMRTSIDLAITVVELLSTEVRAMRETIANPTHAGKLS